MQPKSPPNPIRRQLLTSITSLLGFVGVVFATIPFLSAFKPSARAEAAGAPVKVNISKLSPGELMTVEWRGMPVFVYKVSNEAQNVLSADKSKLADPNSDQQQQPEYAQNDTRSRKKGIAVVKGVCTHLGCAPKFYPEATSQDFDPNWQGGFFCPCHGSKFDLAGRVYANVPAPTNLEVPPHYFETDSTLVIGSDGAS
jgi:ubiquinol-cytochrome c reductase iron-sulfur subunit